MVDINFFLKFLSKKWINPGTKTKISSILIILVLIFISCFHINLVNGKSYLRLQVIYITIVFAALIFKFWGGMIVGIIAGVILGPLSTLRLTGTISNINEWSAGFILALVVGIFSGTIFDILSKKINRLAQQNYYNQITKLPNRQKLQINLDRIINYNQVINKQFVLLVVSIDNFADVFSIIGYKKSDEFLQALGSHLQDDLSGQAQLYHANSNKFNILLLGDNKSEALKWVKEYSAFLQEPMFFNGIPIYLKTSIGLAHYPTHSNKSDMIINKAYIAMNKARANKLNYRWYHQASDKISKHNFLLLGDVKKALREDEFELHYQPKINLNNNKVEGLEALIRWNHSDKGYIPPNRFIPQVEQTGLINNLTTWVLKQAIEDWLKLKAVRYKMKIAINITARDLHDPDFVKKVAAILKQYDIPPSYLEFEITERDIMKKFSETKEVLNGIVNLGITISLDDFGTGYSSLAYLKYLPNQIIKIDRTFIKDILTDDKDKAITKTAVNMAHLLDKTVVAEGVESQAGIDLLKEMDCDIVQGYYISKPKPLWELTEWFNDSEFKV